MVLKNFVSRETLNRGVKGVMVVRVVKAICLAG
jgi:hypothetical protein